MGKSERFDEYYFLDLFYQEMLKEGKTCNLIWLSVNARMVKDIYEKSNIRVTEKYLRKMANICFAHGWLKHAACGDKYRNLQLTTTGFGVVKSQCEQNNRSIFKKFSDWAKNHGADFFLATLVALATLVVFFLNTLG